MFEWRRKGQSRNNPVPEVNPAEVPKREPRTSYAVGTNNNGEVVLRIGEPYTTSLIMNTKACRNLIRLLEAAMIGE